MRKTSIAVANTAADQLRSVGITASVLALDPPCLRRSEQQNRFAAIVAWHRAGGDLATALASRYGCPALEVTAIPTTTGPVTPDGHHHVVAATHDVSAPPSSPTTVTSPTTAPESGQLVRAPSNLTGACDRSAQPKIDAALDGSEDIVEVLKAVESRLWNMSTVLLILQDTTPASGPSVQNVSLSGAVPVGIIGDAGNWVKVPQ